MQSKSKKKVVATCTCTKLGNESDQEYNAFLNRIEDYFLRTTRGLGKEVEPLFTTDTENLFDTFLTNIPVQDRQYHTCHACRHFIDRFGGLVTIDKRGKTVSAIWNEDDAPDYYKLAIAAMISRVKKAKVTGVFLTKEKVWGNPVTGIWKHFAIVAPAKLLHTNVLKNAGQSMAEKKEDFKNVMAGLIDFPKSVVEQALRIIKSDSLCRSEKVLGPAEWLYNLHIARESVSGPAKANVVWKAVATAPAGFCHPRSSMIGTLLEDISQGLDFDDISRRFKDKMHPLQYQRPQAAPTEGNIEQAEKIVEKLGIEKSLARRFCRLEEVEAVWKPKCKKQESKGGVFGHLKTKEKGQETDLNLPVKTMTWDKFLGTIIPSAEKIEMYIKFKDNFVVFVTAVNPDAPPIFQWDLPDRRNPVSWYVWHRGSYASEFGLQSGCYHEVSAVTFKPSMWNGFISPNQGESIVFLIKGAKETKQSGLAIFPEILKSDFHSIRSTIEAFSNHGEIEDIENATACGIMLRKGDNWDYRFKVTSEGYVQEYKLDRWD